MKNVSVRALGRKEILAYAAAFVFVFFLLPLPTLLPYEAFSAGLMRWLLLAVIPAFLLVSGSILGVARGFCAAFPLFTGVVAFLSAWVFGVNAAWQYAVEFSLLALAVNAAAELLYSTRKSSPAKRE